MSECVFVCLCASLCVLPCAASVTSHSLGSVSSVVSQL